MRNELRCVKSTYGDKMDHPVPPTGAYSVDVLALRYDLLTEASEDVQKIFLFFSSPFGATLFWNAYDPLAEASEDVQRILLFSSPSSVIFFRM